MKYCGECGKQINKEAKFCEYCGNKFNETKGVSNNPILVILKYVGYLSSFILFFYIIALIISEINGECYENTCKNNLIMFISGFVISLFIAIICSIKQNKK